MGKGLLYPLNSSSEFQLLLAGLQQNYKQQLVIGTAGSQSAYYMAGLIHNTDGPVVVVTSNLVQAQTLVDDLTTLVPERVVLLFPALELLPYDVLAHSLDLAGKRMAVLTALFRGEQPIIVAPIEALMRRSTPWAILRDNFLAVNLGDVLTLDQFSAKLVNQGYERVDLIEGPGQFAIRGGIVDVFPITGVDPIRIELFDDEVDSLRYFDVATQRSLENLRTVLIPPVREIVLSREHLPAILQRIKADVHQAEKRLTKAGFKEAIPALQEKLTVTCERLEQTGYYEGLEHLLSYIYPEQVTFLDYLPQQSLVLVEDVSRTKEVADHRTVEWAESHTELLRKGQVFPGQGQVVLGFDGLLQSLDQHRSVLFSLLPKQPGFLRPQNIVNLLSKTIPSFMGKLDIFAQDLRQWRKRGYPILILAETDDRCRKILESLKDEKLDAFYVSNLDKELQPGNIIVHQGYLSAGFEQSIPKIVVITEKEIFGQRKKSRGKARPKSHGQMETFVADLKEGDYVVHVNHGIGRYLGVQTMDIGGIQKDYLILQYAGEDKLYVPTEQVNLVQKYLGAEGARPKLYKLGGTEWTRVKNKVKESVKEMAEELIALYAVREARPGYAFSPDTVWQQEFEDGFSYEETPDQIRAVGDIKKDMEHRQPMDRLLCGDVGYGKTEVAIRAVFKAIMDGKQVAVLVPTTILAQQHYNTFRERFSGFPITVEMLSRFRSAKEQKETLKKLANGQLDVVIGTHRVVQEDVQFKDLGLVVVDEEQRFGVVHKEKLKQLRKNVDVLTLTATPIPRTLHMSLVGARDMSVLENPPEDRFPVQTYVVEYNPGILADAISREIDRGGQVYFVHNRIQDLDKLANEVQAMVPEARIVVAHGRMREEQLEQKILEFMEGEHDILVCTTIIETGLDIPNVNTIIINAAENMGLAQLYQLRGRVGRSNRLAYAYLTYRKDRVLSEAAEKRLQAIREFTEFGSGFKIAMRDLEIRGAGNILGPEQHGFLASVGFDLYCRLLEDAVKEQKGEEVQEQIDPLIEIVVDAYLDDQFIPTQGTKMEIYKKMVLAPTAEEVDDLEEEIQDRFGDLPQAVRNLLDIARVRVLCRDLFISNAGVQGDYIYLKFAPEHHLPGETLVAMGTKLPGLTFTAGQILEIKQKVGRKSPEEKLKALKLLLLEIKTLE